MVLSQPLLLVILQLPPVLALPTTSVAREYATPLKVDESKRKWGTPVAGQALSIVTNKSIITDEAEYKPEEPIVLEVIFKNVGNEEVYAVDAFPLDIFMYELTVLLPDGKKAPLTLYGKRYCEDRTEGSSKTYMHQPGEEKRVQFALSRLFDLSRAGKYTVFVEKTVFTKTMPKVQSNKLEITIMDVGMPCRRVRMDDDGAKPPKEAEKECSIAR